MRVLAAVLSTNLRAKVKDEYRIKLVVDLGHGGGTEQASLHAIHESESSSTLGKYADNLQIR